LPETGPEGKSTAMNQQKIERFPPRRESCIWLLRADDAWLVLALSHGWLHGSYRDAMANAGWLARNLGLPIRFNRMQWRTAP
jgi:hypothetical protein